MGITQVLWGYLLTDKFSLPWDGVFHPHVNKFVSALGSRSFWEWAGGFGWCFGGLHHSLFVLPTPWHHFCSCTVLKRRIGSRKVFPYFCTAPSFQADLILTLTSHCPSFHRHAPNSSKLFNQTKRVTKLKPELLKGKKNPCRFNSHLLTEWCR